MRKKAQISWIDYKWWFIFAVCTVFLSIRVGEKIQSVFYVSENPFVKGGFLFLTLVLYALAALTVFLLARRIGTIKNRNFLVAGEVVLWLVVAELFVLRHLFPQAVTHNNLLLLRSAMISLNNEKMFFNGAESLYVDVLAVMFAFLGNHEMLVYYFQFALQMLSTILLFFAVRFLLGAISAYVTAVILALSLCFGEAVLLYQPEAVYLFLWSIAFFSLALCYRIGQMDLALSKLARYSGAVFTGFLAGIASYFDLAGLLLAVTGFYLLYLARKKRGQYILKNVCFLFGIMLGFFVMLFREAVFRNNIVSENLMSWLTKFTVDFRLNANIPKENLPVLIVISMFCMALVVFFLQNSSKGLPIFAFYILALCAFFPMMGFATVNLNMWITFAWAAMAGLGLQCLLAYGFRVKAEKAAGVLAVVEDSDKEDEEQEAADEENEMREAKPEETEAVKAADEPESAEKAKPEETEAVKAADEPDSAEEAKDSDADKDEVPKDAAVPEDAATEKDGAAVTDAVTAKDAAAAKKEKKTESRYDTSTGTKYLDNPLPLPAKPVRRIMDYPYPVSQDKMCYDIEVSENDDYDV